LRLRGGLAGYAVAGANWYDSFLVMIAQAMRAVLFATATATTRRGLRPRKAINQGSTLAALLSSS
jgi:hypothetical protein